MDKDKYFPSHTPNLSSTTLPCFLQIEKVMKFYYLIFLTILSFLSNGILGMSDLGQNKRPWEDKVDMPTKEKIQALREVEDAVRNNGCDTNLCFALQGGDFVTNAEYRAQLNFADVVVQIITTDAPANYAGAQYHSGALRISELTRNRAVFLQKMQRSQRHSGGTNIVAGIRFCTKQIGSRRGDANKMILIGNGFRTLGRYQNNAARKFRNTGGALCAITVGKANIPALQKLTRNRGRILRINQFFELSEIIVDVVRNVCNLAGKRSHPVIL